MFSIWKSKNTQVFWVLLLFLCTVQSCFSVYNCSLLSSGLCGRDAHPQGCSCGQPGVYQRSLDSGSESWVSPVIRSVSSFLFLCNIQHLSYTFARDHHQTQVGAVMKFKCGFCSIAKMKDLQINSTGPNIRLNMYQFVKHANIRT